MNKLTNYQIDLISKVKEKLSRCHNRDHHIILQVHTHIQRLQATGKGAEVLEHYIASTNAELRHIYYWEDKILDFSEIKKTIYSRANRHKVWKKVLRANHKFKQ